VFRSGGTYRATANIYNYSVAGSASIDWGTASGTYTNTSAALAIPATVASEQMFADLTLNASFSGTIYWRAKFAATGGGTVYGAEQSFVATSATALPGSLSVVVSGLPTGATATIPVTGPSNFSQTFHIGANQGQTLSDVPPGLYQASALPDVVAGTSTYLARPASPSASVPPGGSATLTASYKIGRKLAVSSSGTGSGQIKSAPSGISCGTACSAYFADSETVTLSALPAVGSTFTGWGGACTGTGACTFSIKANSTVTASFELETVSMTGGDSAGAGGSAGDSNDIDNAGQPGMSAGRHDQRRRQRQPQWRRALRRHRTRRRDDRRRRGGCKRGAVELFATRQQRWRLQRRRRWSGAWCGARARRAGAVLARAATPELAP